jgi:hypothetical protein
MAEARDLFRNEKSTEFVIVTIPTIMAASESCRLAVALRKESVPVKTIVINQVRAGRSAGWGAKGGVGRAAGESTHQFRQGAAGVSDAAPAQDATAGSAAVRARIGHGVQGCLGL